MVFIYHGTRGEYSDNILENGLKPRKSTGRSNWSDSDMDSLPNHVYLTDVYGIYFGMCSVDNMKEEPIAVFKINLDMLNEDKLYPDEDFIEQAIRKPELGIKSKGNYSEEDTITQRTKSVRDSIELYKEYWMASLNGIGNISHKGKIPSEAIKSVSVVNAPMSFYMQIDPTITIENYTLIGKNRYKFYNNLIFGKKYTVEDAFIMANFSTVNVDELTNKEKNRLINKFKDAGLFEQQKEQYENLINNDFYTITQNSNYNEN